MVLFLYAPYVILVVSSLYLLRLFAGGRHNLPPGPRPLPLVGNLLDLGATRTAPSLASRSVTARSWRSASALSPPSSPPQPTRPATSSSATTPPSPRAPSRTPPARARTTGTPWAGSRPAGPDGARSARRAPGSSSRRTASTRTSASATRRCGAAAGVPRHAAGARGRGRRRRRVAFTTVLNMLSCTVFSTDLAGLDERGAPWEFKDVITEFTVAVGVPNVSDFFPALAPPDPQRLRRRVALVFQRMHAMIDEHIERRLRERAAGEPHRNDFLDVLLDYRGAEDGRGFDRQTLLSLLTDLFSAGSDTSASTVEWVMAELLQNPSSMAKARDELAQVMGSKPEIEESDIGKLKYLQAIVKETFRLHPPAPLLLPHQAETTAEIGGYTVPKGAPRIVQMNRLSTPE